MNWEDLKESANVDERVKFDSREYDLNVDEVDNYADRILPYLESQRSIDDEAVLTAVSGAAYDILWPEGITQPEVAESIGTQKMKNDNRIETKMQKALRGMGLLDDYNHAKGSLTDAQQVLDEDYAEAVRMYSRDTIGGHPNEMYAAIIAESSGLATRPLANSFKVEVGKVEAATERVEELVEAAEERRKRESSTRDQLENLGIDADNLEGF